MKISHKHVRKALAKIRHKGFEVVPVNLGSVVAYEGSLSSYDKQGGAAFATNNPVRTLKTIRQFWK